MQTGLFFYSDIVLSKFSGFLENPVEMADFLDYIGHLYGILAGLPYRLGGLKPRPYTISQAYGFE